MAQLLDLPYEVLNHILGEVQPSTIASLSRCCKDFHRIITNNTLLFRSLYLNIWDDPPNKWDAKSRRWEEDVKRFTKLEKILQSSDLELKRENFNFVADGIQALTTSASPGLDELSNNLVLLRRLFDSADNLRLYMCNSTLFARARSDTEIIQHKLYSPLTDSLASPTLRSTSAARLLSAKLHCLHGAPIEDPTIYLPADTSTTHNLTKVYHFACSVVYDLRNYTPKTEWGPFLPDGSGRVDWEMIEAIMMILSHNLRLCRVYENILIRPLWSRPFAGVAPGSHILHPPTEAMNQPPAMSQTAAGQGPAQMHRPPADPGASMPVSTGVALCDPRRFFPDDPEPANGSEVPDELPVPLPDPYGITGTWMRVVCFLDYTELFAYNFTGQPLPPEIPRPPLTTDEAIRMIVMHIKVKKVEEPGPEDGKGLPVIHFWGTSRPRYAYWDPNATANVRGIVRLTKEGEGRWTTWSIYHGEERWKFEGVQVGGVKSARGVVGNWFDKDYDRHGPAGPSAFWKLSADPEGATEEEKSLDDEAAQL